MSPASRTLHNALIRFAGAIVDCLRGAITEWKKWVDSHPRNT